MPPRLDGRKTTTADGRTPVTHTPAGKFAPGNPGGPGRPRRAIERDYLLAISEACPLETWRAIVERAIRDAKHGDAKAREWLASYLVGRPEDLHKSLRGIVVEELAGLDTVVLDAQAMVDRELALERSKQRQRALEVQLYGPDG